MQVWLCKEVICRWNWSELWIFNSNKRPSPAFNFPLPLIICSLNMIWFIYPSGLCQFLSFFNQSWWHHLGCVVLFLKRLQTALMLICCFILIVSKEHCFQKSMWCFLLHHVQINFIPRGLVCFLFKIAMIVVHKLVLPCAAGYSCVRQTSWFVLRAVCSARFDWPASQTAAHRAVWLYSGASAWRGIPPPQSGWHTEPTKASGSTKGQCEILLQEGFQTGLYLHHWFFALLAVQLELQLPHPILSFPQLLPSPPLALFALSLQMWQLFGALL